MKLKRKWLLGLIFIGLFQSSCSSMRYLVQAGRGQLALFSHARPISEVLKDERIPPRIKNLLSEVEHIKAFGEKSGLMPTQNYRDYVSLDRPAAVWVVSASETLAFKAKLWRFPLVGSFPYLGWFDLDDAKEFAANLKQEGWDVDLRGASAYSTLGWFRDSILSSMIPEKEDALGALVNVVLHESVHATLYIEGQSFFNESLASFVADRLTLDYLTQKVGVKSEQYLAYVEAEAKSERVQEQFVRSHLKLSQLYSSSLSEDEKRSKKLAILGELKSTLGFKREINNATLLQYRTYHTGYPELAELLKRCSGQVPVFFKTLSKLTPKTFKKSQDEDFGSVLKDLSP